MCVCVCMRVFFFSNSNSHICTHIIIIIIVVVVVVVVIIIIILCFKNKLIFLTNKMFIICTDRGAWLEALIYYTVNYTRVLFTLEALLKIMAEGTEPWQYFYEPENGKFNCLYFVIVVLSWALISFPLSSSITVLRLMRLIRLLTFIKGVPQLRAILAGLFRVMY
jgi:uncharacterized membrane protein